LRPWPLLRLGLFLYDHLGGRKILPPTRSLDLTRDVAGKPLKAEFTRAFEYSDCWVDDARLVVTNAIDAHAKGARILPRTKVVRARRADDLWQVSLKDGETGRQTQIAARALVNTAGPWVSQVMGEVMGSNAPDRIRTVKGSHVVVDRLYDHDRCYIFQNADGRICFAIPYEEKFTLIGTTDEDFTGDPERPEISASELDYLLSAVSAYLKRPVTRAEVRWTYSGVRPLYDDGASKAQEATRDYVLKLDAPQGAPPALSVFGGKITTFRRLAEAALERLAPFFPGMGQPWTSGAALPGGEFAFEEVSARREVLRRSYPFLTEWNARRIFHAYGTRAERFLAGAAGPQDLGMSFGPLSEREVDYLQREEWARTPEDILWRRSKLGLHLSGAEQEHLRAFMNRENASDARRASRA
jgi:glycerol-3-phosphate dehydrogenase